MANTVDLIVRDVGVGESLTPTLTQNMKIKTLFQQSMSQFGTLNHLFLGAVMPK